MKYNININQLVLSNTDLDLIDCAILDYLIFYCSSQNVKIDKNRIKEDGETWTWINYQVILDDMPLLRLNSLGALSPRMKKLEETGYISLKRVSHQKLYIKMNNKVDELFIKTNRAVHDDEQSYSSRRTNNNTIYNNTNDNISLLRKEEPKVPDEINQIFNIFYKSINPTINFGNKTNRKAIEDLIKKMGFEKTLNTVNYAVKVQGEKYAPTITTPYQLYNKLGDLMVYYLRNKKDGIVIAK